MFGDHLLQGPDRLSWLLPLMFAWLFATIPGSALSVVRHAEHPAERPGGPYGCWRR